MIELPTPETDAACWIDESYGLNSKIVHAEFARKLERERDKARNLADKFHCDQVTLLRERDEAQMACQLAHDRLLRGDNDREILDILAKGWRATK